MPLEIERKFLPASDDWRDGALGTLYRQGYLCRDVLRTVRVRRAGDHAYLTVKGTRQGITRDEFEYEIPVEDAEALFGLCLPPLIEKTRYERHYEGFLWQIDEFHGLNEGLTVAEIELPAEETPFAKPPWIGPEVTHEPRYFNSRLAEHPFCEWQHQGAGTFGAGT
jgi:CYTH domain-containing protein